MGKNIAFIVPEADVKGKRKTTVMRTELGASLALGMSPHVREAYSIEGNGLLENKEPFYERILELTGRMAGKGFEEIRKIVEDFSEFHGYTPTRLVPLRN